ncbi:Heavy metal tolerance protein [Cyphellophora attinorum]|uniref:Heavy metal tolerance protein n=1 Tax=Cyphellophora attinorum TaxID=1664694 RepID=A0A0N0NM82_9EURO|nr:Heavy metal tolerance protein [Phialophora attinorum]KPI40048.1 Heavy metal tolerance protein [Phialophora attinorum]
MLQLIQSCLSLCSSIGALAGFLLAYLFWSADRDESARHPLRSIELLGRVLTIAIAATSCIISIAYTLSNVSYGKVSFEPYIIACSFLDTLLWLSLALTLTVSSRPVWNAYGTAALVSCLSTAGSLVYSISTDELLFPRTFIALVALRCTFLIGLCAIASFASCSRIAVNQQTEHEPLLRSISSSSAGKDGELDDPDEESLTSDDDELVLAKRQEIVKTRGGLLGYLKEFKIFWPYLWPSKNRRLQGILAALLVDIIAHRIVNVLYARQFGLVVDGLYEAVKLGGALPWETILLWIFLAILAGHSCGLEAISEYLGVRLTNWSRIQLQAAAFNHVMGLPMSFHDDKDSGEIIKAIEQAGSLASLLNSIVIETLPFLCDIAIALFYVSTLLDIFATVIVLYVVVAFTFVTYFISLAMVRARRDSAAKSRSQSRLLYEVVSNFTTVTSFGRRSHEQRRLRDALQTAVESDQWNNDLHIYLSASQELVELMGLLAISMLAAYKIAHGSIPVGNFVTIYEYWDVVTTPLWILGYTLRKISSNLVDAERLLQLFQESSPIKDGPIELSPCNALGAVSFSDVSFAYSADQKQLTLHNIDFTAQPGQTIALVGATGAGKSTVIKLLLRFFDVCSPGAVTIDGHNIKHLTLDSLRGLIGIVPQSPALFNTSLLENVRYGRLTASDAEVHAACHSAAIHERILSFPQGYHTRVGERGVKLSGGELQRIAIARVILQQPRIVLLDEATSALDTKTEQEIQRGLVKDLTQGRTTIVIAHRLSTVVDAHQILVLDEGRIVERGSHQELLDREDGRYRELWGRQIRAEVGTGRPS